MHTYRCRLALLAAITLSVASCGGGGGDGGAGGGPSSVHPQIVALVLSFPTNSAPPGFVVGTGNTGVAVRIADSTTGASIKTATVTVNGMATPYQAAADDYEAYLSLNPGDTITFSAVVNGQSYTQTTQQFSAYPVIDSPTSGSTWSSQVGNQIAWSGVPTVGSAQIALGIFDTSGNLVWPGTGALQQVSANQGNYQVPGGTLSVGDRFVLVGLLDTLSITGAAAGSGLLVGGFNYTSVTVSAASLVLNSITCVPSFGAVSQGKSRPLAIQGSYSDGSTGDVSAQAGWVSSDGTIASVSASGIVTGILPGTATITANVSGLQCQVPMDVIQPAALPSLPFTESTTYRVDYSHTGNATLGGQAAVFPPSATWFRTLDGSVSYPVVGGGLVYVTTTNDGNPTSATASVYALDLATGTTVWGPKSVPATYNLASLTYASGKLYVQSYDGVLYALDGATGAQIWSAPLGFGGFDAPPNAVAGIVYAAGSSGMVAVDATNGVLVWQWSFDTMAFDSPTVAADGVYATSQCWANKFDPLSGVVIWQISNGCSGGTAWTSVYSNNRLYVSNLDPGRTYSVFDAQSATKLGTSYTSVVLPAVNGTLGVFIDRQGVLMAVDLMTGTTRWANPAMDNLIIDPLLVDNLVIAATVFGDVYAYDLATGAQLWTGAAGAQIIPAGTNAERALPGMGIGDGWLIVPADHSVRAWKLIP